MDKLYEINTDIIYVKGAKRGAIYNFKTGKVYSINDIACKQIEEYINKGIRFNFLDNLYEIRLLSKEFTPKIYNLKRPEKKLNFVWLEITSKCNLRCIHCYQGETHQEIKNSLSEEQWKDVIKQLSENGCGTIEFIGGEPTCSPFLLPLIEFAGQKKMKVLIYSNLTLFTEELLNICKKNYVEIHCSLYGTDSNSHDRITTIPGSFSKSIYWIKRIIAEKVNLIPSSTIMNQNQGEAFKINGFIKSLGINNYKGFDIVRKDDFHNIENLMPDKKILREVYFTSPKYFTNKNYFQMAGNVNTCWFGKFVIGEGGDVFPCEFERKTKYGNVKEKSIKEILEDKTLDRNWYWDFSKIENCQVCEYRYACKDCRPLASNLNTQNPRCLYNPYLGEWGKL